VTLNLGSPLTKNAFRVEIKPEIKRTTKFVAKHFWDFTGDMRPYICACLGLWVGSGLKVWVNFNIKRCRVFCLFTGCFWLSTFALVFWNFETWSRTGKDTIKLLAQSQKRNCHHSRPTTPATDNKRSLKATNHKKCTAESP
jgi:hypothetical protein